MAALYARYRPPAKDLVVNPVSTPEHAPVKDDTTSRVVSKKRKRGSDETTQKAKPHTIDRDSLKNATDVNHDHGHAVTNKSGHDATPNLGTKHSIVLEKFRKVSARAAQTERTDSSITETPQEQVELHDLVPIPQPPRAQTPEYVPEFSALPPWLREPIVVSSADTVPFEQMSLREDTKTMLKKEGYTSAFAVQTALVPRLLAHPCQSYLPPNDLCVSAPTGSGKTLGYVLPIVESLKARCSHGLRAIIVVPTRELVAQAHDVAKRCAKGHAITIKTATGNRNMQEEAQSLVVKGTRYDAQRYDKLMQRTNNCGGDASFTTTDKQILSNAITDIEVEDALRLLPYHVPTYTIDADILICTPGRLVEHLDHTHGFNLDALEWLVLDEADRLLDQSFQGFVERINTALRAPISSSNPFPIDDPGMTRNRYVRKIILSATMTRDVSTLNSLRLRRPTMIVVQTPADQQTDATDAQQTSEIPASLAEFAVAVGAGEDKPLFLIELLRSRLFAAHNAPASTAAEELDRQGQRQTDADSSSSSDSSESSSDDISDDDSMSSSDESSEDDSSTSTSASSDSDTSVSSNEAAETIAPQPTLSTANGRTYTAPMALIFTSSSEEASRLHHLISNLLPRYQTTLFTKSSSTTPSHLLHASTTPRLIISTDKASRGLDLAHLTHTINYSMPRSTESYIHRVGRTARAGRAGEAWTLFKDNEGRWFWNQIARSDIIRRARPVERVKVVLGEDYAEGGEMRRQYELQLDAMRRIVQGDKQ